MTQPTYPRDLVGYGAHPPRPQWPGDARVAVQFVLNYEEGGERCVLEGDPHAETFLCEIGNAPEVADRHMTVESVFEYGSRAGVWRVLREFARRRLPLTVFGVARALQRNPEVSAAIGELGHEVASHGLRWLPYQDVDEATERAHIEEAVRILTDLTGAAPLGWYTGRDSPNTRRLVVEHGGFLYDSDHYGDDLPFWTEVDTAAGERRSHLVVPYTLDANDMRFSAPHGFGGGDQFFAYLRDAFDVLYEEGAEMPKMLSVGLHGRLIGRPGRFRALQRFLDHIERHDRVWVCKRIDIARHWAEHHPPTSAQESSDE